MYVHTHTTLNSDIFVGFSRKNSDMSECLMKEFQAREGASTVMPVLPLVCAQESNTHFEKQILPRVKCFWCGLISHNGKNREEEGSPDISLA